MTRTILETSCRTRQHPIADRHHVGSRVDQLVYEGFSREDSTFAVEFVDADWFEQAALKAQAYLDMTSFSRSGLIKQLEYEGFTRAQAEHGVAAVGL